ncbi:hypothetical protein Tco_0211927 [Tanacetum coccineum]
MVKNLDNAGKFLMYPRFVQVFLEKQLEGMKSHNRIYVTPSHTKKIFRNMKRVGKGFSGRETPLFPTMVVQNQADMGEGSAIPTDPHHTPIQPSTSQPQRKQRPRKPKRKDTEVPQPSGPTSNVADEAVNEEMDDSLERAATTATGLDAEQDGGNIDKTQSKATPNEPSSLGTSSGGGPKRQETMGDTIAQTRSENVSKFYNDPLLAREHKDCSSLGDYKFETESQEVREERREDASKQVRKIDDIDKDVEITLVDETQGRYGDDIMFDVSDLAGEEVFVAEQGVPDSKKDDVAQVNIVAITVSTASTILVSAALITDVEITLAQSLAELKSAKPTTATSTRSRSKGLIIHEQEQAPTPIVSSQQPSQAKIQDKERIEREKVEANIALKETWDDIQAKIEADCLLAEILQAREQEELTIEERAILFQQLLEKRRKHFAAKRAEEKMNRPPTKAQQRSIMCTYLKNIKGWKPKDLKSESFANIQEIFDKAMKRVNTFVDYRNELQKVDEDKETAELKSLMEVIFNEEELAVDAIPLATKPPSIGRIVRIKRLHDDLEVTAAKVPQTTCRPSAVRLRDQEDPYDDAHPEGDNHAKRWSKLGYNTTTFQVINKLMTQVNGKLHVIIPVLTTTQPPRTSPTRSIVKKALEKKFLEELKKINVYRKKENRRKEYQGYEHEQQVLVDYKKLKISRNDLGIKRFPRREIDEEYERDCEIRIRELKQDFNEWGSKVRKKEQAYEEEQYA